MLKKLAKLLNPTNLVNFFSFSRPALFRISILALPIAIMLIVCKLYKIKFLLGKITFSSAYMALRNDISALVVVSLIFLFWIDRTSGYIRSMGIVLAHFLAFFALLLLAFEQGYFLVTGSFGDWHILRYIYRHSATIDKVVLNQINWQRFPLLMIPVVINLLPSILERIPPIYRWLYRERPPLIRPKPMVYFWTVVFFILLLTGFPVSLNRAGAINPLTYNFFKFLFYSELLEKPSPREERARQKARKLPPLFNLKNLKIENPGQVKKYNVFLILLESTRWDATTLGNPKLKTTPFLAELAKKALVAEYFYPVIPHTSKAFVSTLCGIYPKVSILIDESNPGGIPAKCLPKLLAQVGYRTAFFQSSTLKFENFGQLAENAGFQESFGIENLDTKGFFPINSYGYQDEITFKPMLQWIDRQVREKRPFFITYLSLITHFEYTLPPNFKTKKFTDRPDPSYQQYLNAVYYFDLYLKRLFKELEKRNLLESTIFVLLGDHGEAFGEHFRRQHDTGMWEEQLRIPLVIYNPKLFPKQQKIKGFRQQIDLLPTMAQLLNIRLTGGKLPGTSLLKPVPPDRTLYFSCSYERYCIGRRDGWIKYIYNYHRHPPEIYDLKRDPLERKNLFQTDPNYRRKFEKVLDDLFLWRERVNLLYPPPPKRRMVNGEL